MRHAISLAAAASGTVLLALGLFGDPATYLREARSGWQSAPANDIPPPYVTPPSGTSPSATSPNAAAPNAAVPSTAASGTATSSAATAAKSDATPPLPADHDSTARDATMARMDALQSEVAKLREALAERGQGGTGDLPDKKDTDRQPGGADNAKHPEPANPPGAIPQEKANQDLAAPAAPQSPPQAVAQRATPPATSDIPSPPAPVPPPAVSPPAVPPPAAAPVTMPPTATPPAVAQNPVAEPRIAERAPEPPKAATANVPAAQTAAPSEPAKAAPDLTGPKVADRSERSRAAVPKPDQRAVERASPPETPSHGGRRTQLADRSDARDTTPHRPEAATNKPAPRADIVTPPLPPRAIPPAGNPPVQAVTPPIAVPQPRHEAARPPIPGSGRGDDQDTDAVLARLRQAIRVPYPGAPTPEPMQLVDASQGTPPPGPSTTAPRATIATGPIVGRLRAARNNLMAGRIEEARKDLQQAQLSLVFRPVGDESGGDVFGAGAASVGRALSALGQNDVRASLSLVDRAAAELLHGSAGNGPAPLPQKEVAGGYAPAYPPR